MKRYAKAESTFFPFFNFMQDAVAFSNMSVDIVNVLFIIGIADIMLVGEGVRMQREPKKGLNPLYRNILITDFLKLFWCFLQL